MESSGLWSVCTCTCHPHTYWLNHSSSNTIFDLTVGSRDLVANAMAYLAAEQPESYMSSINLNDRWLSTVIPNHETGGDFFKINWKRSTACWSRIAGNVRLAPISEWGRQFNQVCGKSSQMVCQSYKCMQLCDVCLLRAWFTTLYLHQWCCQIKECVCTERSPSHCSIIKVLELVPVMM